MTQRLRLLIAMLLWGCASLCLAQAASIRFVDEGGRTLAQTEAVAQGESLYFTIESLRDAFDLNLKQQYIPLTKTLILELKGKRFHLQIGEASATLEQDGRTIALPRPPLTINGRPMLPIEFFTELIPQVYDFNVSYNSVLQTIRMTEKTAFIPNLRPPSSTGQKTEFLVVVDAGHGGKDTGCRGNTGIVEKNVVLDLAKQIKELCQQSQIRVLLTRESDVQLRPSERSHIANQNQGQLFLSLHCNASFSFNAEGIRLYINNSSGELKSVSQSVSNPTSQPDIIKVLSQGDFLMQSRKFATLLQNELEPQATAAIPVTEIPLVTLSGVYMPAVLIEIGYLSNGTDAARLSNADNISSMATAISRAVQKYIKGSD